MPDKHSSIKIREHKPGRIILLAFILICAGAISSYFTYEKGLQKGLSDKTPLYEEKQKLEAAKRKLMDQLSALNEANIAQASEIKALKATITANKEAMAGTIQQKTIDQIALEETKKTLFEQNETIGELKEKNAFYQAILSPTNTEAGLRIQHFKIRQTSAPRIFQYDLSLVQALRHETQLRGRIYITLEGIQDNKEATLKLSDISKPEAGPLKYKFKYHQTFSGSLILPEGFTPIQTKIVAKPSNRSADSFSEIYNWNKKTVVNSVKPVAN